MASLFTLKPISSSPSPTGANGLVVPVSKSISSFGSSLASTLKTPTTGTPKVASSITSTPKSPSYDPYSANSGSALPTLPSSIASAVSKFASGGTQGLTANISGSPGVVTTPSTFSTPTLPAQITPQGKPIEQVMDGLGFNRSKDPGTMNQQFVGGSTPAGNPALGQGINPNNQAPTIQQKSTSPTIPTLSPSGVTSQTSDFGTGGGYMAPTQQQNPDPTGASYTGVYGGGAMGGSNSSSGIPGISDTSSSEDEYQKMRKRFMAEQAAAGGSTSDKTPLGSALDQLNKASQMSPEEKALNEQLNNLDTSKNLGLVDTENKPIALPFITGQQRAIEQRAGVLQQPLEKRLALMQAQRQMSTDALKATLPYTKPESVAPGSSLIDPLTGKTVFGGMGTYAEKQAADTFYNLQQSYPDASLSYDPSKSWQENLKQAQQSVQNSPSFKAKNTSIKTVQLPGGGFAFYDGKGNYLGGADRQGNTNGDGTFGGIDNMTGIGLKADAQSLKEQQGYLDTTQRAFNTANDNLNSIVQYMQTAGINSASTVPIINDLNNKVQAGLTNPGTIAAFRSALAGLRAEYSQVLARGGTRSVQTDQEAASLIPDNLTASQLSQVAQRLNIEGTNAIKEAQNQINTINGRISSSGNQNSGTPKTQQAQQEFSTDVQALSSKMTREQIQTELAKDYPEFTPDQIHNMVYQMLPNGWEQSGIQGLKVSSTSGASPASAKSIAEAIKTTESGGNYNAKGKSGESGAYQFMPDTWKQWSSEILGNPNAPLTPANQDKVAQAKIDQWINQGYNPEEIALMWNGGTPVAKKGVNKFGVAYDSGSYAKKVLSNMS